MTSFRTVCTTAEARVLSRAVKARPEAIAEIVMSSHRGVNRDATTPLGLIRQIHREKARIMFELELELFFLRFLVVTDLELDGMDLGPLMNYTNEIF
jgi:hypothetical protein